MIYRHIDRSKKILKLKHFKRQKIIKCRRMVQSVKKKKTENIILAHRYL